MVLALQPPKEILMGYKFNSQETRQRLAERDGGFYCHYCGCKLIEDNSLAKKIKKIGKMTITSFEFPPEKKEITVDHAIPRYQGGTHDIDNLVLSCKSCNSSKGIK